MSELAGPERSSRTGAADGRGSGNILELEDVRASYGRAEVLHGVSLQVSNGGVTAVLGANGAGKTTTLRAISGMVTAKGRIDLDGQDVLGSRPDQVARMGVAHVPQGRGTLDQLSVRENLLVGAYQRRDRKAVEAQIAECFELFPALARRQTSTAGNLSGGEQQMLAVCRALMSRPRLLLLDEPSLGLAPRTAEEVFEAIGRLQKETGLSMLVVEQTAALALALADTAVVLEIGRTVLTGPAEEMAGRDEVRRAYLGD
ncbi:ABC transporter ATP-binding protein [Geodermatophilus sp. TF02-6]|uniref:ABC transporter ATP-binding protein n=1 Tax=Geodermatophilus sp. TF02-6 TaxID=2250575 RepID=UPI000DEBA90C|nr:ABC transporter ATP-binding protein [Geodermatophilus sp. TF02-6]RBY82435.1 ABC transporter ATP-binding protein [Geodermatophilus sp. TF02-6]